ncbi:hypothetical protein WA1_09480 [Scytonema hofmannii PCC 7110]|uniref:Uncharacterized protein n=1 Tax=Scytonema hofmannii PCC 7110 TaxID=128403 RepID=A0A139WRB5_9CYAN|nr:hypothetical protein WA1_09480 [Scytonema hofmannii PCC 7110]
MQYRDFSEPSCYTKGIKLKNEDSSYVAVQFGKAIAKRKLYPAYRTNHLECVRQTAFIVAQTKNLEKSGRKVHILANL